MHALQTTTGVEVCMHAALAAGHDQAVLQAALRRLQQPQVARLITYLLKWVTRHPGEHLLKHSPVDGCKYVCCSDMWSEKSCCFCGTLRHISSMSTVG